MDTVWFLHVVIFGNIRGYVKMMDEGHADAPQSEDVPRGGDAPQSGDLPRGGDPPQSLTELELRLMQTQACQSICTIATHLHLHSIVPQMHTYINVYLLWIACMQAIYGANTLQELDPKHELINYFKQMPLRKLTVIIPAVCFWISVKCTESSISFRSRDVACMIAAVQLDRGDYDLFSYSLEEIAKSEYAALQLVDFDILGNQDRIDAMEDVLQAHFGYMYEEKEAQSHIVHIISRMFDEIVH